MHKAAFVGRDDIVQLLLAHNADVSIRNEELRTARQLARSSSVAELLAQVEQSDRKRRETRFLQSAKDGDLDSLRQLLSGPLAVNINCCDESGNTALHCAAIRGHKQVIAFLLQQPGVDSSAKNKTGQIPAMLAPNNALKRLLLHVQPMNDTFAQAAGVVATGNSTLNSSRAQSGHPERFEGELMRRTRFVVWKRVWAVLDRGGFALFPSKADADKSQRRVQFVFLHSANVQKSDASNMFTLRLEQRARIVFQVATNSIGNEVKETSSIATTDSSRSTTGSSASSSAGADLRRVWCEMIERHAEFARRLVTRGVCVEMDSEDETLPGDRTSCDNPNTSASTFLQPPSEDRVQNLLDTAHAHLLVLTRHLRGLRQLVEEDLQHVQSTLPEGLSVECSRAVMHCMKRFWPTLTFHLNFVQESAQHTNDALQHCVNVMDRQYKVRLFLSSLFSLHFVLIIIIII